MALGPSQAQVLARAASFLLGHQFFVLTSSP
jgi:hypothetical protein